MLDRNMFKTIMAVDTEQTTERNLQMLRKIPIFNNFPEEVLLKICDLIVVVKNGFFLFHYVSRLQSY